jgi:transcriptional regulator with XRE-family HTH domain
MVKPKVTDFDRYVGERIREARLSNKMSQTKLGELLGVSFQQIQKYETGKNRAPSSRLELMVTALNRPLMFFFPNPTDVRTTADPLMSQFISSKIGLYVAQNLPRLSPAMQTAIVTLIKSAL